MIKITETFPAPVTKAGQLFWLKPYVRLSQEVFRGFQNTGETSETWRHISNCAARWGISRACAEALLKGDAEYDVNADTVTITRPVPVE